MKPWQFPDVTIDDLTSDDDLLVLSTNEGFSDPEDMEQTSSDHDSSSEDLEAERPTDDIEVVVPIFDEVHEPTHLEEPVEEPVEVPEEPQVEAPVHGENPVHNVQKRRRKKPAYLAEYDCSTE